MRVRQAGKGDIETLSTFAIESYTHAFGFAFSASDLEAHLEANLSKTRFSQIIDDDVVLVAETGDRLVGYVQFGAKAPGVGADQELRRLYIHRD